MSDFPTRAELITVAQQLIYQVDLHPRRGVNITARHARRLIALLNWALDTKPAKSEEIDTAYNEYNDGYVDRADWNEAWQEAESRALPPFRDEEGAK